MQIAQHLLWPASTHARACLVAGLLAGLLFPALAARMVPWLPHMVAVLLAVTALRVGHRAAKGAMHDLWLGLACAVALQLALPLIAFALLWAADLHRTPAALAILLTTAAPAITGSVNLALLLRLDAGRMMQILILGTALFPLTILPILFLMPQLGTMADVVAAGVRVLGVILGSAAVGFALRAWRFPDPTPDQIRALDGLSVIAFSVIAVGLMAALTPALLADPWTTLGWALLAFFICYALQLLTLITLRRTVLHPTAGVLALGAGNRNIAIFLVALPPEVMAPLMIFVGCWQLPMYLTPLVLPRLYTWALHHD